MFSFGPNKQTARVAGEFYVNAINVMRGAESVSTYSPIAESEKFRIEYWALEEAKLAADAGAQAAGRASRVRDRRGIGDRQGDRPPAGRRGRVRRRRGHRCRPAPRPSRASSAGPTPRSAWPPTSPMRRRSRRRSGAPSLHSAASTWSSTTPGLSISKSLLETTVGDWDLQHDVMARGSFLVSREAARILIDQAMGGDLDLHRQQERALRRAEQRRLRRVQGRSGPPGPAPRGRARRSTESG